MDAGVGDVRSTNKFSLTAWFEGLGGKGGAVKIDCGPVQKLPLADDER